MAVTRVTNQMLIDNFMLSHNKALVRKEKYQLQLATNKRILRLSDDPIGVISSMNARQKIYRLEQYVKNIDNAKTWLNDAETSLMSMNEVLKDALESTIDAATDGKSPSDKRAIAEKIGQIRDHLLTQLNETCNGKYLFSGYNMTKKPFEVDGSGNLVYNGTPVASYGAVPDELNFEIGFNQKMSVSIPGVKITGVDSAGITNTYKVLDDLYNKLMRDAPPSEIAESIPLLQQAQDRALAITAEIGGKQNRLDLLRERYMTDWLNYTEVKSRVEDADQAEVAMQLSMANMIYESALAVGAKIISPTLVDFLR